MGLCAPQQRVERYRQVHANAAPLVAWPAFLNMAVDAGVPLQDVPAAAQFLVDNGDILYFGTRVPALRDLVILDCQWLPRLFASVISLKSSFVRDGEFEHSVLMQVLFCGVCAWHFTLDT